MLTKADGERIRQWNETGSSADPNDQLRKRARAAADEGMAAYKEFFGDCSPAQKSALKPIHEDLKYTAEQADLAATPQAEEEVPA